MHRITSVIHVFSETPTSKIFDFKWWVVHTGKSQPIFEGDTIQVFDDAESYVGTVAYVRELAGFYLFETTSGEWREIVGDDRYFV